MSELRVWQAECRAQLLGAFGARRDFLVAATPGAGKTGLSLSFARALIDHGAIDGVHVVAPTRLIAMNWREKAAAFGIELGSDTDTRHGGAGGLATTYAQVAQEPQAHAAIVGSRRTLVIPDECHHSSDDRAWGVAMKEAFDAARFRLNLSGTPFRMDAHPIPFIEYTADGISKADYLYGYTRAIAEGVCRPVSFSPYNADVLLKCAVSDDEMARVLRRSLMPEAGIVEKMVRDANADLTEKRKNFPDAAGLLVAMTQAHARDCARIVKEVTGVAPPVIISDSETAEHDLAQFRQGTARWVVSVKMLSEGVDVPRLMVAIYATNIVIHRLLQNPEI
jgi:superfamily II DNA or RNA helicase